MIIFSNLFEAIKIFVKVLESSKNRKDYKKIHKYNLEQKEKEHKELVEQSLYLRNNRRIDVMPRFNLVLDKEIELKQKMQTEEILIFPISLKNIGQNTATNIKLEPVSTDGMYTYYSTTDNLYGETHGISDYLDKQYAMVGETVHFTLVCNKHNKALNVSFRIKFDDIDGRIYEQDFRFGYCYPISNKFSMNNSSDDPVHIEHSSEMLN